jgi:hypothetical protein
MRTLFILLAAISLTLSGCDSVDAASHRMRERFDAPQPKTRIFEADNRAVFEAARVAVKRLDFQVSKAAFAQGIIKGHSSLRSSDTFGKARQLSIDVALRSYDTGKTEVSVQLREQEESTSFAGATDLPLREHALYDSYFAALEQALRDAAKSPGPSVNSP